MASKADSFSERVDSFILKLRSDTSLPPITLPISTLRLVPADDFPGLRLWRGAVADREQRLENIAAVERRPVGFDRPDIVVAERALHFKPRHDIERKCRETEFAHPAIGPMPTQPSSRDVVAGNFEVLQFGFVGLAAGDVGFENRRFAGGFAPCDRLKHDFGVGQIGFEFDDRFGPSGFLQRHFDRQRRRARYR